MSGSHATNRNGKTFIRYRMYNYVFVNTILIYTCIRRFSVCTMQYAQNRQNVCTCSIRTSAFIGQLFYLCGVPLINHTASYGSRLYTVFHVEFVKFCGLPFLD